MSKGDGRNTSLEKERVLRRREFFVKFRARGEIPHTGRTKDFLFETLHQFLVTRSFSVDGNLHYHHSF